MNTTSMKAILQHISILVMYIHLDSATPPLEFYPMDILAHMYYNVYTRHCL